MIYKVTPNNTLKHNGVITPAGSTISHLKENEIAVLLKDGIIVEVAGTSADEKAAEKKAAAAKKETVEKKEAAKK